MRMYIRPMSRTGSEVSGAGHGVTALILGLGLGIIAESLYPQLSRKYQEYQEEDFPEQVRGGYRPRMGRAEGVSPGRGLDEPLTGQSLWVEGVSRERRGVTGRAAPGIFTAEGSIAIGKPPVDVYRFWKDLDNLPRIFDHLDSVNIIGRWRPHERVARFTSGPLLWDIEITNDIPNELITWTSVEGAQVKTQGEIYLEPRRYWNDTVVTVSIVYEPPLGSRGAEFAAKFGDNPSEEINRALRKLKGIIEYGGTA